MGLCNFSRRPIFLSLSLHGTRRTRCNARPCPVFYRALMKIALAQLNPTVGDFAGNSAKILDFARRAAERGVDLAVFSELCLCGYLPMDLIERPHFIHRNERELARLATLLPLPAIVGFAAHANGTTGKSAANAA